MPRPLNSAVIQCVISAGIMLTASTGHAADTNAKFAVRGPGASSCAAYLASANKPADHERFASWLLGYASARNRAEPSTYDFIPTDAGQDFPNIVSVVCKNRLEDTLEAAASKAINALAPLRQTDASPLVDVNADGQMVQVREQALRRLQQALIGKKFYNGAADGAPSAQFIAALKKFQRSESLPATGLPNIDTFIRAILKR
ncbi:MAG: peptidoglycan-binding domain-containing protein [Sphingobium limneticum]